MKTCPICGTVEKIRRSKTNPLGYCRECIKRTTKKMCTKCGKIKPITEFYKNERTKDGHSYRCMECMKKYDGDRRYTKYKVFERPPYKRIVNDELTTCDILKQHSQEMKNDKEHLTTKFIQKVIGIKCS